MLLTGGIGVLKADSHAGVPLSHCGAAYKIGNSRLTLVIEAECRSVPRFGTLGSTQAVRSGYGILLAGGQYSGVSVASVCPCGNVTVLEI